MPLTMVLLGLAIVAYWSPAISVRGRYAVHPWAFLFLASLACGLTQGFLTWTALAWIAGLSLVAWSARRGGSPRVRATTAAAAAILALGLALHLLPGFNNPILITGVSVSADAPPITQYANFDKGAAGLLLLVGYSRRIERWRELGRAAARTSVVAAATSTVVLGVGVSIGYVRPDIKLPAITALFLVTNFLFTCVPEEAFFRGFVQEGLSPAATEPRARTWLAIALSAALFGIAHAGGGLAFAGLACLAGLGYSLAYAWVRRIEAPVFAHFALNAIQFMGFTYPYLTR